MHEGIDPGRPKKVLDSAAGMGTGIRSIQQRHFVHHGKTRRASDNLHYIDKALLF